VSKYGKIRSIGQTLQANFLRKTNFSGEIAPGNISDFYRCMNHANLGQALGMREGGSRMAIVLRQFPGDMTGNRSFGLVGGNGILQRW
jgi:hypothetical protein